MSSPSQPGPLDLREFREALQKLPSDQREALILIGASGLSYDEAAKISGCAPETMKSRVDHARKQLGTLLALENNWRH